ncbi:hypothetical protein [Methylobacterium sp. JK268]
MPEDGARLLSLEVAHPEPDRIAGLHGRLGLVDPPTTRAGPIAALRARVRTPAGERVLA